MYKIKYKDVDTKKERKDSNLFFLKFKTIILLLLKIIYMGEKKFPLKVDYFFNLKCIKTVTFNSKGSIKIPFYFVPIIMVVTN